MDIKIIISSPDHPVYKYVKNWGGYNQLAEKKSDITPGGILFLVSCGEMIDAEFRKGFNAVVVLHASDLPKGRGWSPHIWQIIGGADKITLTALLAEDRTDAGDVLAQREISFDGTELYDEINEKIFKSEIELIEHIAQNFHDITPQKQIGEATYYPKRTRADSELDPANSIVSCFNTLRVADPERYPAFFQYRGQSYKIKIERA